MEIMRPAYSFPPEKGGGGARIGERGALSLPFRVKRASGG